MTSTDTRPAARLVEPGRTRRIRAAVLQWAAQPPRPLPWRAERDPYKVLVSEMMLQQTQAQRVVGAYERFLAAYPDVAALAAAQPADVLSTWGDLGYPRRAMWLWRCAGQILARGFPATAVELRQLPGVGRYTAGAIASFAFGHDEAVVEANVRRVITRLDGLAPDADVWDRAFALLARGRAAEWNQAIMDFGALVCHPRSPGCGDCPLAGDCAWVQGSRPGPRKRPPKPVAFHTTARYARGRVLAALRERRRLSPRAVAERTGLELARVQAAIDTLCADGLIHRAGGTAVLGPRSPGGEGEADR